MPETIYRSRCDSPYAWYKFADKYFEYKGEELGVNNSIDICIALYLDWLEGIREYEIDNTHP